MGGDTVPLSTPSILHDGDSFLEHDQSQISTQLPTLLRGNNNLSMQTEDDQMDVENGCIIGEFDEIESEYSSAALNVDICRRRINRVHREIIESYDQLRNRSENFNQAKQKILSYSPGAWIEQVGGNSSGEDGTFFLQEYMILRKSKSFCLYDTRGLSDDPSDNIEILKQWMTKGVRHGELVTRKSDASSLINRMRCKARQSFPRSRVIRMINFVIFVVDGLSVLQSIDGDDKQKDYGKVITTAFNCPYLSYGDDKPVVVLTHGDLLSFTDRVRVRGHLGNLLGIPPTKQIFDIPDRYDPVTELTIIDILHYCLEHADKNLPPKGWTVIKDHMFSISAANINFLAIMVIAIISAYMYQVYVVHRRPEQQEPKNVLEIVWHEIRHLWLEE
ncbi:uncharacterized protein LOC120086808 isoform X2 [Benincasa hispida]|uniref:uncharacterized protein LOC120086808 isoform X2 n=1 Tax=Benincasa hispida TaxID=102211 RepID=UPI00190132BA|nr:uncharacterized protein LOC120086808 isoform X2 [Benincasa hispida]